MAKKNVILLIGNGFDVAHNMETKFSQFANCFLDEIIVPELMETVKKRENEHPSFQTKLLEKLAIKGGGTINVNNYYDAFWFYSHESQDKKLKEYFRGNYDVLGAILNNTFLAKLYADTDRNWFDIENFYFKELIKLKGLAVRKTMNIKKSLDKLNSEFLELKGFVKEYLDSLDVGNDPEIDAFFTKNLKNTKSVYVVNFNYTSTVKQYFEESETVGLNYIHGSLEEDNIIFGYGNDQNKDYQEIKNLEINEFLEFFKTFDYLNNTNYDRLYGEALEIYDEFEVYVIGHSLGMTDKTLLSEIFNSVKCKKIHLFKRKEYFDDIPKQNKSYRRLSYAANRILTNELSARKKIVSFEESKFFP